MRSRSPVEVEHLDLDLVADLHHLGRMRDAAPRHVGDVEQAVDAAEVDEGAEVGDVLDDALAHLVLGQLLHEVLALVRRAPPRGSTRRDTTMLRRRLLSLMILNSKRLAEELVDVRHLAQRDLRAGQERLDAHEVDDDAALDLLHERALDRLVALVGDADLLPHAHEVGLLLREHDRAVLVLELLEEHLDLVADLEVLRVVELVERDEPSDLKPTSRMTTLSVTRSTLRLDDLALGDRRHGALVQREHLLVLVGRVLLVVEVVANTEAGRRGELGARGGVLIKHVYGMSFGRDRA